MTRETNRHLQVVIGLFAAIGGGVAVAIDAAQGQGLFWPGLLLLAVGVALLGRGLVGRSERESRSDKGGDR